MTKNLAFGTINYILLGVGIVIIVIGFILMSGDGTTEQMFNAVTEQQIKIDKITELETFKNKANDVILSHEIRIKSLNKDFDESPEHLNNSMKYSKELINEFTNFHKQFNLLSEEVLKDNTNQKQKNSSPK